MTRDSVVLMFLSAILFVIAVSIVFRADVNGTFFNIALDAFCCLLFLGSGFLLMKSMDLWDYKKEEDKNGMEGTIEEH